MAWLPGELEAVSHIVAEACRGETTTLQSFLGRGEPLSADFAEHLRLLFIAKSPFMPYRLGLVSTALRGRPKKADADNRANLAALDALRDSRVVDAMAWLPGEQEAISHIVAEACRSETNALQSFLGRGEPLSAEFAEHLRLLFIAKHPYMPYRLELVSTALRGRPKKADADNRANLAALYALGQIRSGAKSYLAPEEAAKLFGVPNASVDRWVSLHRAWLSRGPDTWLEWMLRDRATEIEAALKKRAVPGITRTA